MAFTGYFNPRPRMGRPLGQAYLIPYSRFQSTPPRGGDCIQLEAVTGPCYFNPRPLAGATPSELRPSSSSIISIHAPSRGRLWNISVFDRPYMISIHAPSRGRLDTLVLSRLIYSFQSTPPRGGDREKLNAQKQVNAISIHAPSRGRPVDLFAGKIEIKFQSTPPRGGDVCVFLLASSIIRFQSTPPRGGDRWPQRRPQSRRYFNPRPLAGATSVQGSEGFVQTISIHAPSRGRQKGNWPPSRPAYFNPRPLAGATIMGQSFHKLF